MFELLVILHSTGLRRALQHAITVELIAKIANTSPGIVENANLQHLLTLTISIVLTAELLARVAKIRHSTAKLVQMGITLLTQAALTANNVELIVTIAMPPDALPVTRASIVKRRRISTVYLVVKIVTHAATHQVIAPSALLGLL